MKTKALSLILFGALILLAVSPVMAQGLAQEGEPPVEESAPPLPPAPVELPDAAAFGVLLIAITSFFRKQFELQKRQVIVAAFCVGLFLWFAPQLAALVDDSAVAAFLNGAVQFVSVWLAAMGTVDFVDERLPAPS